MTKISIKNNDGFTDSEIDRIEEQLRDLENKIPDEVSIKMKMSESRNRIDIIISQPQRGDEGAVDQEREEINSFIDGVKGEIEGTNIRFSVKKCVIKKES